MGADVSLEKRVRRRLIDEHAQRLYQAACTQPGACERLERIYHAHIRDKIGDIVEALTDEPLGGDETFDIDAYDFCQELARLDFWRPRDILCNMGTMAALYGPQTGLSRQGIVAAHRHLFARAEAHDKLVRAHTKTAERIGYPYAFTAYCRYAAQRIAFGTPENMRSFVYARFAVEPPMRFEWLLLNEHFVGGEEDFLFALYQDAYEPLIESFHERPSLDSMTRRSENLFADLRLEQLGLTLARKRRH